MVTITDARLRHTVWETMYDLINSTKSTWNASTTPTLQASYGDFNSIAFPLIVLRPVNVDLSKGTVDTERSVFSKDIYVDVEFFVKANEDLDNMTDGLMSVLLTPSNLISGVMFVDSTEDDGFIIPNENKLKQKIIRLHFIRR